MRTPTRTLEEQLSSKTEETEKNLAPETEEDLSPELEKDSAPLAPEELDIVAVKKILDKAYGPESSSIIVGQEIPILEEQKIEPTIVAPKEVVKENQPEKGLPVPPKKEEPKKIKTEEQAGENVSEERIKTASKFLDDYKKNNEEYRLSKEQLKELEEALGSLMDSPEKGIELGEGIIGKIIKGRTETLESSDNLKWARADDRIVEYLTKIVLNATEGEKNRIAFLKDNRISIFENYLRIAGQKIENGDEKDGAKELREQIEKLKSSVAPEEKPVPLKEKKPVAPKLDAKEESTVTVDVKSTPISEEKIKKDSAPEAVEKQPTVEELTSNIREEQVEQEAQVKVAKNELIDLAKRINEAREKKDTKTETSLYKKVKEVFEVATGESLEKTVREKAKIEAEEDGFKIITPEQYRKEKTVEAQKGIQQKERTAIIKERWDMLSVQEKEKYFSESEDKNNQDAIDSARIKFATELNKKIEAKRQELTKGKKGIFISEDVFYELMKKGLKSEDIKKVGFFGGMFSEGEIKIPPLDKTDKRGLLTRTREHLTELEIKVKKNIEEAAHEEIERRITYGQKIWRARKQKYTKKTIQEVAVKYEAEKLETIPEGKREQVATQKEELKQPDKKSKGFEDLMKEADNLKKEFVAPKLNSEDFPKNLLELKDKWAKLKKRIETARKREGEARQKKLKLSLIKMERQKKEDIRKIREDLTESVKRINQEFKEKIKKMERQKI